MSTCKGTEYGYTVQVRSTFAPRTLGRQIVTEKWTDLQIATAEIGIPNRVWSPLMQQSGLLTYENALGMVAWATAIDGHYSGLDFRLVKKELTYEWAITEVGVGEPMNLHEMERAANFGKSA